MKDDFFSALTREIRDEVMERYITERRLIELQVESLKAQSKEVLDCAEELSWRLARLSFWMRDGEMRDKLISFLNLPEDSPWVEFLGKGLSYELYSIHVNALRDRMKLRKLLIKSYERAYGWSRRYRALYEDLRAECDAVNSNIEGFQRNFNVMNVLSFLKSLEPGATEKSHFLGGNFSAYELTSIEQKLRYRPISMYDLSVVAPLSLPVPDHVGRILEDLADEVFELHRGEVKKLIQAMKPKGY